MRKFSGVHTANAEPISVFTFLFAGGHDDTADIGPWVVVDVDIPYG